MGLSLPGTCIICRERLDKVDSIGNDLARLVCPRCGTYRASAETVDDLRNDTSHPIHNNEELRAGVGYHLHLLSRGISEPPLLTVDTIEKIKASPYRVSLSEMEDNFVRLLGDTAGRPGVVIAIQCGRDAYAIGAVAADTVVLLAEHLIESGLASGQFARTMNVDYSVANLKLTIGGWLRYEEILRGGGIGSRAFMAMPFGQPDLDTAWLPAVREGVGQTGFQLRRVDDEIKPGIIDVRMRQEIRDSRFVIVELTHANNGAYWEAGYAEGLGKPVIYTCRKGEPNIHFDTSHLQRIEWEPDHIPRAIDQLKAMIRLAIPEAKPD